MINWIKNFIKNCNTIEKEVRDAGYIYHYAPGYNEVIVQKVQKGNIICFSYEILHDSGTHL